MAVALSHAEAVEHTDRRVLRSRQLLVDALAKLLKHKDFDSISIQEITNEADLTRATFYLHFADKAALLQAMTAVLFGEMLKKRLISRIRSTTDLKVFAQAVCEYLAKVLNCQTSSSMPLERAVIPVMEGVLRAGAKELKFGPGMDAETYATAIAWAIYGAASHWAQAPNRKPAEEMAQAIEALLRPIMRTVKPTGHNL